MIGKNDALLLLSEIQESGVDCNSVLREVAHGNLSIDVLKFINDNRQLDLTQFYEKVRQSYNDKKSRLYKNIVNDNFDEPKDILTTLGALQLQILLFSKSVQDTPMFLRSARFDEISKVFLNYMNTGDYIPCQQLLHLFKADIKALEYVNGKG